MRPAPLLLAASLAACSTLSRRLESEERAFLEASCALATAADVRVERGVLPAVPADAPTDDWRASDATVRIDADRAGASIAGQPVPLEALESTLAAATASPGAEIVLVIAADTPAWVWQPVVRAVSLRQDLPPHSIHRIATNGDLSNGGVQSNQAVVYLKTIQIEKFIACKTLLLFVFHDM